MFIPLLCCISDFIVFALCDQWLAHCVMMYAIAYYIMQDYESLSTFTFVSIVFWMLVQDVTLYGKWGVRLVYLLPLYFVSRSVKTNFLVSRPTFCVLISLLFMGGHYAVEWYLKGGAFLLSRSTFLSVCGNISLLLWFIRSNTLLGMLGNRFEKR